MVQHQSFHPEQCHSHTDKKCWARNQSKLQLFVRLFFCIFQYNSNASQNGQLCRQAWCPCTAIYVRLWPSSGQYSMMSIYLHENASVLHAFVGVIDIATADYGVWSHPEGRLWQILLEIADHLKVHNCFPDSHTHRGWQQKDNPLSLFCIAEKLMDFLDSLPRFKWSGNHSLTPDKVEVTDHLLEAKEVSD